MSDLSSSLQRHPGIDAWLALREDGVIDVFTGKVEIGQGIRTALTLIAAEELDVEPQRIRLHSAATGITPNELVTAGSMSVQDSGGAIAQACIHARAIMLSLAAGRLGVPADQLQVQDGQISGPGFNQALSWWDLQLGRQFDTDIHSLLPGKPPETCRHVGHGMPRVDLPAKVSGAPAYVHDLAAMEHPGELWHARIVRPPDVRSGLESLDTDIVGTGDDRHLVINGSFVAVVCAGEGTAVLLAERLARAARWQPAPALQLRGADIHEHLRSSVAGSYPLVDGVPVEAPVEDPLWPAGGARVSAAYSRPYLMHGSIGPSAAAAHFDDGQLTVWSHSQGVELLRPTLAKVLDLPADAIEVRHREGAGAYGHNGADDVACDAALCARACPGRTVLVKWTREQEHLWEPYGPAMVVDLSASVAPDGQIGAWRHDVYSFAHVGRPMPNHTGSALLAAQQLASPLPWPPPVPRLSPEAGIHRNALPLYAVGDLRVVKHFVADSPLRTSALRALGAHGNVFAIESFMDELALHAGVDSYDFRLQHLRDERARAVLEGVRELQAGRPLVAGRGRGVALARYKNVQTWAAVVAEVSVSPAGETTLHALWICADAGRVIDPDGLVNQLEGGAIQSASWALKEAVSFDAGGVTCRDWDSYPMLRFDEIPEVATRLLDRPHEPPLGAGEATTGPTTAAIANAVCAASGIRVRNLPLTPENLARAAAD